MIDSMPLWTLGIPVVTAGVYMILTTGLMMLTSFTTPKNSQHKSSSAPFVSTPMMAVRKMLELSDVQPGEVVMDLGCGDGRFLRTAEFEYGATGIGYEGAKLVYWLARFWGFIQGSKSQIFNQDFWDADISSADVVFLFLLPRTLLELESKLLKELKPGARVVTFNWEMKGWKRKNRDFVPAGFTRVKGPKLTPVYVYEIPEKKHL
mmetsp:Transcript_22726/g.36221  ORF Transcript_22726/g.36221 Transcript_22726/m.36221 type:complete len:206 (+) Transcript_22726:4543-5160(+)